MVKSLIAVAVLTTQCTTALAGAEAPLRLYLPRNVMVNSETMSLGMIAVVRGDDRGLVKKAVATPLGRAPWSKEKLVVDRRTILTCLASNGIEVEEVEFAGAAEVSVFRKEITVNVDDVGKAALVFLQKNSPAPDGVRYELSRRPKAITVPSHGPVDLHCQLDGNPPQGFLKVNVQAFVNQRPQAQTSVLYRLVYTNRQVVASKEIPAGEVITDQNTRINKVASGLPEQPEWKPPYGMVARRLVRPGTVIRQGLFREPIEKVIVKRNEMVTVKIEADGFVISCLAKALQDGRLDESIKVRNIDSNRIIIARVADDGTVRPPFERTGK